ncbi:thioredoxin [Pseudoflavonifractor sp. BIOML-A6]|nr:MULTISPECIES: CD1871A family CXXC motif-containing protein [unclassified Pseudoflavonifractor]MTQ98277.1 thioredoxin [Pseudoflavonifractor sp. BIOML-A16]MTR07942.1 thioredoxin [Pseudoflavonifractor sp. BIOML-A15]MTR33966.1 thioredoxin [Pseudoflavonifractor sp. BIOML-A14]MTR74968.1 thioredoxin [Pseudoflavonifractor sp. BIOML-A18]MTS65740.1 thioredoxin [Pseudoflavonifractor sp. BIOML-A5]MTS73086.1 thioredoxin [Pseudoflavonifractor sp. BIOML-A8]MTS92711.1 thioredoxin [Pseudoflavonifractor sp
MSFLRKNRSAAAVLLIGLLFVVVGVWRGEVEVVFRKAVNICMECIGLG